MANYENQLVIVRDSIKHLISGRFKISSTYCAFDINEIYNEEEDYVNSNLQSLMNNDDEFNKCNVCEVGGLFYSTVARNNNYYLDPGDLIDFDYGSISLDEENIFNFLSTYFHPVTLVAAEAYYETELVSRNFMDCEDIEEAENISEEFAENIGEEIRGKSHLLYDYKKLHRQLIINLALIYMYQRDEYILRHYHVEHATDTFELIINLLSIDRKGNDDILDQIINAFSNDDDSFDTIINYCETQLNSEYHDEIR